MAHKSEKTEGSSNVHSVENMITDLQPCFVVLHKLETVGIKVEKDADKNYNIGEFSLGLASENVDINIKNENDSSSPTISVDQIVKDEAENGFGSFMEVDFGSGSTDDHFKDRVVDFRSERRDMNKSCTNDTETVKEEKDLISEESYHFQLENCHKCLMSFNSKIELKKHKWEKHGHEINSPYCCGDCYTVFRKKISIKYHLRENGHKMILQRKRGILSTNKFPTSPETVGIIDSCTLDISAQHQTKVVPHILVTSDSCINIQNIVCNGPEMIKETENQGLNFTLNKGCVYQKKIDPIKEVDQKISEKDFVEEIIQTNEGCDSQESLSGMEVENINQKQFSRENSDSRKKSIPATENNVSRKSSEINEIDSIHGVLDLCGASVIRNLQHQERPTCGSNRNSFNKETVQSNHVDSNNQIGSMANDEVESFNQVQNEKRCLICSMAFSDKEKLKRHIITHATSDLIKYYSYTDKEKAQIPVNCCTKCFNIFETEIDLRKHIWKKHRNGKVYCCNDCYYSSVTLKTAANHFEKTGHKRVIKVCKGKTRCIYGQYNPSLKSYFQFGSSDTRRSKLISRVTPVPIDKHIRHTPILLKSAKAVDQKILHTSIIPKTTTAVVQEIHYRSILPKPTTAVDETRLLPKPIITVDENMIMFKRPVNENNNNWKKKQYSVKGIKKSKNSDKMNSKCSQILTNHRASGTTLTAAQTQNCTEMRRNKNDINNVTNYQNCQSENNICSKSLKGVKKSSRKKQTAVLTAKSNVDVEKSDLHVTSDRVINNSTYDSRIYSEKYMCKGDKTRCPSCSFFNHPKLIRYHFWYHHLVDKDEWYRDIEISSLNCKLCESVNFSDTDSYKRHIRSHILDPECKLVVREGSESIQFGVFTTSANLQKERETSDSVNIQNKTGSCVTETHYSNLAVADSQNQMKTLDKYSCTEKSKSIVSTSCHDEVSLLSPSVLNQQIHQTLPIDGDDMGLKTTCDLNNRNGMSSDISVSDTTEKNSKSCPVEDNFNNISEMQFFQETENHTGCNNDTKGDKTDINAQKSIETNCKETQKEMDLVLIIDIPTENIPAKKLRCFRCDICERKYTALRRVDGFLCHVRFFHHGNKNGYCCKICGKMHTKILGLITHLRRKYPKLYGKINVTTISQFCGKIKKDNSRYCGKIKKDDSRYALENLNFRIKKKSKKSNSKEKFKKDLGRKVHKCAFCHKRFQFQTLCILHEKEHYSLVSYKSFNGNRTEFGCKECRRTFITKRGLNTHIRAAKHGKYERIHDSNTGLCDSNIGLCHLCGKVSVDRKTLYRHLYKHHPERILYNCQKCRKGFMTENTFSDHKAKCEPIAHFNFSKGYPFCYKCEKWFFSRKELLTHLCLNRKDWMCDICGRKFVRFSRLKDHLAKHSGIKNFACPHCNKMFYKNEHRTRHVKSLHRNDANILCDKCGKMLAYIQSFIYHKKSCPGNW